MIVAINITLSMEQSSRKNGYFKEIFKLTSAIEQGCSVSYSSQCPKVSSNVMGNANEAQVSVNSIIGYRFLCFNGK